MGKKSIKNNKNQKDLKTNEIYSSDFDNNYANYEKIEGEKEVLCENPKIYFNDEKVFLFLKDRYGLHLCDGYKI